MPAAFHAARLQVLDWFKQRSLEAYSISCGQALIYNNIFPKHKVCWEGWGPEEEWLLGLSGRGVCALHLKNVLLNHKKKTIAKKKEEKGDCYYTHSPTRPTFWLQERLGKRMSELVQTVAKMEIPASRWVGGRGEGGEQGGREGESGGRENCVEGLVLGWLGGRLGGREEESACREAG